MTTARKLLVAGLAAATFSGLLLSTTPAAAWGRGWGGGGWGRGGGGWGRPGWGGGWGGGYHGRPVGGWQGNPHGSWNGRWNGNPNTRSGPVPRAERAPKHVQWSRSTGGTSPQPHT